ncbi:MAG: Gluconeogenesis factor [Firmicutes bacterium ADurb.Bin456]|nr:MAG: Gluconeogenesis factor [Firmicutes bacterium ADurb.Bin456]
MKKLLLLKWLYPGMCVKRWLFLALAGLFLAAFGVDLIMKGNLFGGLAGPVHNLETGLPGGELHWLLGIVLLVLGLAVMSLGILRAFHSVAVALAPEKEGRMAEIIYARHNLRRGPRIVVIGGGTGLSVLLRGLKEYTSNLTAIVSVADDGGSSGRLRGDLGMLPPGDIRNCLVALADKEPLMEELLQYRFKTGELAGHSLGNLLLAALTGMTGSFDQAVRTLSKVLAIRGQVLPVTLSDVTLCAELEDGAVVQGQSHISRSPGRIKKVFLQPSRCLPLAEALFAIRSADAVVLGPGSLYTSIIPNLLVKGIPEALAKTQAPKIYICNVMTQPGETDGYTASGHLEALFAHGGTAIDYAVVNTGPVPPRLRVRYLQMGANPVAADMVEIERMGVQAVGEDLVHKTLVVRHHQDKLAQAVLRLTFADRGRHNRVRYLNERRRDGKVEELTRAEV